MHEMVRKVVLQKDDSLQQESTEGGQKLWISGSAKDLIRLFISPWITAIIVLLIGFWVQLGYGQGHIATRLEVHIPV